jgi:spore maturation protein CgeB
MSKLGHKVTLLFVKDKKLPNQITLDQVKTTKPDLLFLLSPFYVDKNVITAEAISWAKNSGVPIVCYSTLNTQVPYTEMNSTWRKFDLFFCQHYQMTQYLKSIGVDAHFMPLGFYPDQYYPENNTRMINVSFMGSPQTTVKGAADKRVQYVKALAGHDIAVFGKAFMAKGVNATPFKTHQDQRRVYSYTKINLDLPFINSAHPFYKNMFHCKNRLFEVPATNSFLLTARNKEFTAILGEDMVGYYDDSIESLRAAIDKYLKNDQLRRVMATRAYHEVMNKHTFSHRFQEMFKIIEG